MMMEGRGEILTPMPVNLDKMYLVVLFPGIHIRTAEAYAGIQPDNSGPDLRKIVTGPVTKWKNMVVNDFEVPVFAKYPLLEMLKKELYRHGAVYASLSGSGSSIYGIFQSAPVLHGKLERIVVWKGTIRTRQGDNP
jgi:4-diphosphocytidyl-2-C-methyl-D-erythritol kinase